VPTFPAPSPRPRPTRRTRGHAGARAGFRAAARRTRAARDETEPSRSRISPRATRRDPAREHTACGSISNLVVLGGVPTSRVDLVRRRERAFETKRRTRSPALATLFS
jgi:hypothetical protein